MKVSIIAVGKIKEHGVREAVDDYCKRIGRYAHFREVELKDGSDAEVQARFEKALPTRGKVVAMEVEGKAMSSERLARLVGQCEDTSVPEIAFLIGGAYGLPKAISARADVLLSLSAMKLPHRLARLLLAEQVYRAFTILRNAPYSH